MPKAHLAFCKRADNSELGRNYANLAIIIEKSGKSRNSKIEKNTITRKLS